MEEAVRDVLHRILTQHGSSVIEDPRRLRAILMDLAGSHSREISLLMSAAEARVPQKLLDSQTNPLASLQSASLIQYLEDQRHLTRHAAQWAVETWAFTLDLTPALGLPAHSPRPQDTAAAGSQERAGVPPTLVVATIGPAHHRSISAAIAAAGPGTRIRVRPGIYREGLILDKPLEIWGDGPIDEIVVETTTADCILMRTDSADVRGLTLRCRAVSTQHRFYGVDIPQGQLTLEDCDITSNYFTCVAVRAPETVAIVRRCHIHHSEGHGVCVSEQARGTITDCDIHANESANIEIELGGDATVRGCRIHDGKQSGVWVHHHGRGNVADCDIHGNAYSGISISTDGDPTVRDCRIHDNNQGGVYVSEQGRGTITDCDIHANEWANIEIKSGGDPTVRGCRIHDGVSGVRAYEQGRGTIADCDIHANSSPGVTIESGGDPAVRDCRIHDNNQGGVYVSEQGRGTITDCDIHANV
ncbi:right-handed parallel beta-helix repeat-containing protein, partial [Streptomyces sp. NPDC058545]|uniref:right-handed parallel beta-helix repeat-containing protein n=1 Tax=Streptomyces sp. NPDC058545 TaxID=3346544 RepID=UPI003650A6BB